MKNYHAATPKESSTLGCKLRAGKMKKHRQGRNTRKVNVDNLISWDGFTHLVFIDAVFSLSQQPGTFSQFPFPPIIKKTETNK